MLITDKHIGTLCDFLLTSEIAVYKNDNFIASNDLLYLIEGKLTVSELEVLCYREDLS